jgi:hypothetical protein
MMGPLYYIVYIIISQLNNDISIIQQICLFAKSLEVIKDLFTTTI